MFFLTHPRETCLYVRSHFALPSSLRHANLFASFFNQALSLHILSFASIPFSLAHHVFHNHLSTIVLLLLSPTTHLGCFLYSHLSLIQCLFSLKALPQPAPYLTVNLTALFTDLKARNENSSIELPISGSSVLHSCYVVLATNSIENKSLRLEALLTRCFHQTPHLSHCWVVLRTHLVRYQGVYILSSSTPTLLDLQISFYHPFDAQLLSPFPQTLLAIFPVTNATQPAAT